MARYLALGLSAVLFVGAAFFFWKGQAGAIDTIPTAPAAEADRAPISAPPQAEERTREQKRFDRYDKDRDSSITRDEYLASRRKAYAKLDSNGDGRLSFDEWVRKTSDKFAKADGDGTGALTRAEFETTKVKRKSPARCACPPEREEE